MAAYPTLPVSVQSRVLRLDGYTPVRATNGALKVRKLMAGEKAEFDLVHEISAGQRATLESHYQGDKLNSFSFAWPTGGSYTVRYLAAPQYDEQPGGWFKARVRLGEV